MKFRVFQKSKNKYILHRELTNLIIDFKFPDMVLIPINDLVFEQFTGAHDEEGVEIYVGDIIRAFSETRDEKYVVEYDAANNKIFGRALNPNSKNAEIHIDAEFCSKVCLVVGNINAKTKEQLQKEKSRKTLFDFLRIFHQEHNGPIYIEDWDCGSDEDFYRMFAENISDILIYGEENEKKI